MNRLLMFLCLMSLTYQGAFAQKKKEEVVDLTPAPTMIDNEKGNGGDLNESQVLTIKSLLKSNIFKIKIFFEKHHELETLFPEFKSKELVNLIDEVKIEVTSEVLIDKNNMERTALNFKENKTIKYNYNKVQELKKYPEAIFILNLHELLGILGVEESSPGFDNIAEGYKVSSRISQYVEQVNTYDLVFKEKLVPIIEDNNYETDYYCRGLIDSYHNKLIRKSNVLGSFWSFLAAGVIGYGPFGMITLNMVYENTNKLIFLYENLNNFLKIAHLNESEMNKVRVKNSLTSILKDRESRFKYMNMERIDEGRDTISRAEFESINPLDIELENLKTGSAADSFIWYINHYLKFDKKKVLSYKNYKAFFAKNKNTDYFCKDGKALKLNKKGRRKLFNDILKFSKMEDKNE